MRLATRACTSVLAFSTDSDPSYLPKLTDLPEAACCDASNVWRKRQISVDQHAETLNAAFWDYRCYLFYGRPM